MNRRDVIRILVVLVLLLWMMLLVMPRRYALVDDLNTHYYDKGMAAQEFAIRKELKRLSKDKLVSEEIKLDSDEALAKTLWATFRAKEAASILTQIEIRRGQLNKNYNQKSIDTMLMLAAVYRDLNELDESATWYRKVWQLDKANLPANDNRLMRDQTNFAVLDYMYGDIQKDEIKRRDYFKNAIAHAQQAMDVWHMQKDPDTAALANLFYLQYLCYRDMGDLIASRQAFGEVKYLNKQLKRGSHLPWK